MPLHNWGNLEASLPQHDHRRGYHTLALGLTGIGAASAADRGPDSRPQTSSIAEQLATHIANVNTPTSDAGISPAAVGDSYQVTLLSRQYNVQHTAVLDSCQNNGSTCTLNRTNSFTATTSGGLSLNAGAVSSSLSLGYSTTFTTSASCTSPTLAYGQTFIMRPMGTFVTYNVIRKNIFNVKTGEEKGSAFFATGVKCSVR